MRSRFISRVSWGKAVSDDRSLYRVIEPSQGWKALRWRELWAHRELLFFFVWRDLKVRYKQTALGAAWALVQPLAALLIFSLVLGRVVGVPSEGVPYPLFAYTALVPWTYFSSTLTQATNSVVRQAHLIRRVAFPRLLIPASGALTGLVDLILSLLPVPVLWALYGSGPSWRLLTLPLWLLLAVAVALGAGTWLAALNVRYRDVRHLVPFLVQLWFFATPVVYPSRLVPAPWRHVYALNPVAGVVEGFRWALAGAPPPTAVLAVSTGAAALLVVSGVIYFRHAERAFADVI